MGRGEATAAVTTTTSSSARRRWWLGIGIFLIYVLGLQWLWGWQALLAPLADLPPVNAVAAILLLGVSYTLRAWRLYDYFHDAMQGRPLLCSKLMLYHNVLNNLLPARSGEISFPVLLGHYFQVPLPRALAALIWFRLLDLHTVLTLGGLALASLTGQWLLLVLMMPPWLALPVLLFALRHRLQTWCAARPQAWAARLQQGLTGLPANPAELQRSWLLTWANWLVKLAVLAWLFRQFQPLAMSTAWLAAVAGELTAVLPIHAPGGFGTYEAGAAAVLLPHGLAAQAVVSAAVNVHLILLAASVLSAGLAWWIPAPSRNRDGQV